MRAFFLVLALLSLPSLAAEPRSGRAVRPPSRPEASAPAPEEPPAQMALVPAAEGQSVDAAGAVGMLTAIAASFVFARRSRR